MVKSIGSIAPWAGSKRQISGKIVSTFGEHSVFWEPFAGGLSIVLAKQPCRVEVVNDFHVDITNLARVIKDEVLAPALYDQLQKTLFCEQLLKDEQANLKNAAFSGENISLSRAYSYFCVSWMGANGYCGTEDEFDTWFAIRYAAIGGDGNIRFRSAIETIPGWHQRLKNVTVLNKDGYEIIERLEDRKGVLLYLDPPYLNKKIVYKHDFKPEHHVRLAKLVQRFEKTKCVLSYYFHEKLAELYPNDRWDFIDASTVKQLDPGKGVAPEVLIINKC